jgi:autotransporter-associated beta strand protein
MQTAPWNLPTFNNQNLIKLVLARVAACLAAGCLLASTGFSQTPAFPGAQGFGRFSTGGRGGSVVYVTNLLSAGPGSFSNAVSGANRTVVFAVGGVIRLSNVVSVANNVTIAGQTAPGGGITLYGHRLSYSGANNTITRFIRVRMGNHADGLSAPATGDDNDSITIASGHDMIFDHLSVSWGQDETFSISGSNPTNITIQSTIVSQGLLSHSAGGLIQTIGGVSILRSFYIDNVTRNPKVKGVNEYVNNVIYNWGTDAYILGGDSTGDTYANVIGNYFINGPDSASTAFDRGNLNFHLYATNNWQDANLNGVLDGTELAQTNYDVNDWQSAPFAYPVTNALPPLTALKLAISDTGDSWQRDSVDQQMFTELASWGTLGETITSEYQSPMNGPGAVNGGTPYTDTDQDGMPDFWELGTGSDPTVANNNDPSPGGSGYTRLEDYLNWLADPHGIALTNTTVDVDLHQFTAGFLNSSPVCSVTTASNGTVTLLDGHVAQFVPTANYIGPAGFQFTVVDADGSTLTRPMNLFFTPLAQSFNPIWHGDDATNNWSTPGDNNWSDGISLLYPFHTGDKATFDDSGSTHPAVNLVGALQPASVTVNATKNYTFSGGGSLAGTMSLNKTNNGTLTLDTMNNFTGATTVSTGALIVNGSLSQSAVTVYSGGTLGGCGSLGFSPALNSGASLSPGNDVGGTVSVPVVANGGVASPLGAADNTSGNLVLSSGTLRYTGASASTDCGMTLNPGGGTIEVTNSATTLALGNVIVGTGTLNKTGAGSLSLNGAGTFSGGVNVTQGTVILGNNAGFGTGVITLNGSTNSATLQFGISSGTLNNTLNVTGTNNFVTQDGNNYITDMTGDGTLTLNGGATFSFTGDMTAFSGTIRVGTATNPRFYPSLGNPNPNIGTGSSNAVFVLGNTSATLNNRNGGITVYLGALIGGASTSLEGSTSANNLTTYVIGGKNLDTTFAGKIYEYVPFRSNNIVKVGTGTFTLTGANTYTAGTIVNGGTLLVNNTTGSGTGTNYVAVNSGGTLGGTGFIYGAVTNYAGGTIWPGSNGVGQLTLKSNLFLSAGSFLNFQLGASSDKLVVSNALVLNGTINVANAAGFGPGTYTNIIYGGALSGVLPAVGSKPAGFSVTIKTNTPGQIRLVVQTETPPLIGSVKQAGTNVWFSGSGGPTNVPYYVLMTTNLGLPANAWTCIATNQFDATGNFIFTNAVNPDAPQTFYLLQLP